MNHGGIPEIAVVGMGCRFPGATGVDAFWRLLESNTDAVTPVPADRFDVAAHYSPPPGAPGRTVSRHGGFLDDLYGFDAAFFGIAPRQARAMDPQQRVLLHVVWEALEDAGILPSSLAGSRTGVFVGQATSEYADVADPRQAQDVHGMTGSRLRAVTAGRVSFALDLRGPSIVVDTACSSSLVAVHMARQSLLTGESDLAMAAGVNAVLSAHDSVVYSQGGMLAPDGRCKFGDTSADGFVRSEGVGALLLKRLPDAVRDGDRVLAVLRGSAVTNDGKGSGLLLQPAVSGQVEMVRAACRSAGITPGRLDYVEAHGTGTRVGDGVELRALTEALRDEASPRSSPLRVGSVKSNIGHTEAAAGIAGLIKAVLIARHRLIPASLHLRDPHPLLTDAAPIAAVDRNTPIEPAGGTALLGVSSFGLSGTNAHVVVAEYPAEPAPAAPAAPAGATASAASATSRHDGARPELLVLSARGTESLRMLAERYAAHLEPGGEGRRFRLRDVCHTAAARRDALPCRLWAVGRTHDELAATLRLLAAGQETPDGGLVDTGFDTGRRIAFVFPGQGSQWLGMGRRLLDADVGSGDGSDSAFRRALTECDSVIREELGWSVVDVLGDAGQELPSDVAVVQPVLWAMEVALAALLREKGVEPDLCLGHSMGEAAAAYVSGALSLRDAAAVICRRSKLMQRLAGQGAMLSVELSADEARTAVAPYGAAVCVAAENAPRATVLAGDADALRRLSRRLEADSVDCRPVKVNVASHSPAMEELREDLRAALAGLSPTAPSTEMFSSTRCTPVEGAQLDAAYWMDNLREPVRFVESVRAAAKEETVFLEVSPHPILVQSLVATLDEHSAPPAAVPLLRRRQDEYENVVRALGQVFAFGGRIDWDRCFGGRAPHVPLPSYAWETEHYRQEPATRPARAHHGHVREIGLRELGLDGLGAGVTARGRTPVPPVVHLKAVLDTARGIPGCGPGVLEHAEFGGRPLDLARDRDTTLRVTFEPTAERGVYAVAVTAAQAGGAAGDTLCLAGRFRTADTSSAAPDGAATGAPGQTPPASAPDSAPDSALDSALTRCAEYVPAAEFYRRAESRGYALDTALRTVDRLWRRDGEAVARMHPCPGGVTAGLEAALLTMLGAWPHHVDGAAAAWTYVPVSVDRVRIADGDGLSREHWSLARFAPEAPGGGNGADDGAAGENARCDVVLLAADGRVLAEFRAMRLRQAPGPERTDAPRSRPRAAPSSGPAPHTPAPALVPDPDPGTGTPSPRTPESVLTQISTVLGVSLSRLDARQPLRALGLDSLLATELRVRLQRALGVDVTAKRLLGDEPVGVLARSLAIED
ncbi:type I polyketide synthase [Streptomyces sp. TRM49041]|uniref:type I polyketide synthase n=1 Tax=Streptomyces sp. TRM49041 TaxID=2603216 RepID=UPI0011ED659F|nr:type I polyketide synthase [Streptomyces sp. TRM49041]